MHVSLDGFVAGPNGQLDWIKADGEIFDYVGQFIQKGDTALYGRVTYELMESYWPTAAQQPTATTHDKEHSKWYANVKKIVLSKTMKGQDKGNVRIISENLSDSLVAIRQQPGEDILLFGSPTATHSLMKENLIDGYWLFVNPIILGNGIPLFKGSHDKTKLNLLRTRQFSSGVTELSYTVEK